MISVQSALLVALGFLIASLVGVLMGSALWARAVRLTTARIKQSMPVSEAEIKADRDRLRAEFALRVHRLEKSLEQAKFERARQFIEINRRDAAIAAMEASVANLTSELEENVNARRVLEQTVADRLPRVEARLAEAKRLLFNRDREIAELMTGARRHKLALEEATSLSAQQSAQIEKLTSELSGGRGRSAKSEGRFESEPALHTEVEALRAKTREQSALIERLQQRLGQQGYQQEAPGARAGEMAGQSQEIARLKQRLSDAEGALSAVRSATSEADAARIAFENEMRLLNARAEDQATEIARLTAALAVYDGAEGKANSVKESKLLLKARLSSAQAHSDQQAATIGRLRAELAATQERLTRQAVHFMEEMRRVTQGQTSISGQTRRRLPRITDGSVADRVAHVKPASADHAARNGAVHELASQIKRAQALVGKGQEKDTILANGAAEEGGEAPATANGNGAATAPVTSGPEEGPGVELENRAEPRPPGEIAPDLPQPAPILDERRRPRLLDRLSEFGKG